MAKGFSLNVLLTRQRIFNTLCLIVCYIMFVTSNGTAGQEIIWSCDFSGQSVCGALNVTSQTYFHFGSGETPSEGTGPSGDHSLERFRLQKQYTPSSQYIYLEASWARQEDRAILRLPMIPIVQDACLTFYYHMFSSNGWEQGNLRITITRDSVSVWFVSGNKGPHWRQGQLTLPANTINIQFIAARGGGLQSDIGLDDVMITAGPCEGPEATLIPAPLPPLPTLEPWPTPSPLPPLDPITLSPIPRPDLETNSPLPTPERASPKPIPTLESTTPSTRPTDTDQTTTPKPPEPTLAPLPQTLKPNPVTPTLQSAPQGSPGPCDPRYQYCPSSTTETLAWMISPSGQFPTLAPNIIIAKSTFDWNSGNRNGLGFMITQAEGGHWSEVEESGQPLLSSNFPRRWLTMFSSRGKGTSSITSRFVHTTTSKGCLEYKAVLAGQAALTVYLRQEGVPIGYSVHKHVAYPKQVGTIRLPIHDFMLADIGFYISFKGEVQDTGDFVTIDDITLYNDSC